MNNDLISRAELLKIYNVWLPQLTRPEDAGDRRGVETCIAVLQDAPAVDAVEVVRCKDCKYRGDAYECPKHFAHYHGEDSDFTVDDGYCELGEKLKLENDDGETVPAVDAKPVRHAKWEYSEDDVTWWWMCSECGSAEILPTNYCHNCGAKMDGGVDDVDN